MNVSIGQRYARALLGSVGNLDNALEQLERFASALASSSALRAVAQDPAYSRDQRRAVIDALVGHLSISEKAVADCVRLLTERNRLMELDAVTSSFRALVDEKLGRLRAHIRAAQALSPEQLASVGKALEQLTRKSVVVAATQDPSLIGGALAEVAGTVYDGTLKSQLQRLRASLAGTAR